VPDIVDFFFFVDVLKLRSAAAAVIFFPCSFLFEVAGAVGLSLKSFFNAVDHGYSSLGGKMARVCSSSPTLFLSRSRRRAVLEKLPFSFLFPGSGAPDPSFSSSQETLAWASLSHWKTPGFPFDEFGFCDKGRL